jgi:hypothetical protein
MVIKRSIATRPALATPRLVELRSPQTPPGSLNVAIGVDALRINKTGDFNVAVGVAAGNNLTGSGNILLGQFAGNFLTTSNNNIDIDNFGFPAESDTIRIGTSQTATYIAGAV